MRKWEMVLLMVIALIGIPMLDGSVTSADAALVTQLDFTSGAANWSGRYGPILDRVFDQEGSITMGTYQLNIVDPIVRGHTTYSLLTTNLFGAPAPSGMIDGMSITVDLSSLAFGWQRGDHLQLLNIGGQATGLFNPETSQFSLSWEHILHSGKGHHMHDRVATFFLNGTALVGPPAAIPLPASVFLYASGLFGMGSWSWMKRRWSAISAPRSVPISIRSTI